MKLVVVDFETSGIPTDDDPHAIVEAGWCELTLHGGGEVEVGKPRSMLVDPKRPIDIEAMAVHHITPLMVKGAPPPDIALRTIAETNADIWVAHNSAFDELFFGGGGKPWICTYKAACRVWPDSPSHKNSVLRYYLDLQLDDALAQPSHRAGPDAYVTAHLMAELLRSGTSVEDMKRWTKGPALLPRVTFGKHRGAKWQDLPTDYLKWIVGKSDLDRDTVANARHWLKQREAA